ncbi:RNase adapter RapZ [Kocuria palustris]|uniref:RNase adapter RapZ n=1 Tax=Kocuria palustris TaxID=71999 RepID=UPI0006AA1A90|nr:RNase adapter RapZ [Kocuria palustris]ALB03170.1 glmZ(sRNA)-inactivating NTPase [Kocuria palustris]MCM3331861.1 RNase adapter RapZ [Kocuria palustris]
MTENTHSTPGQDQARPERPRTAELLVVTGLSGAGRSTAANALEDQGWYVVDNLPPQMLQTLADVVSRSPEAIPRLAVVIDVRGKALFDDMQDTLSALEANGVEFSILFLEASDEVLVARYEHQRRPHPLQAGGRILDGIAAERRLLTALRESADVVLDTSSFNVHGLSKAVADLYSTNGPVVLRLTVMSFGFKYGVPADANYVADVRFIPNPHWVPALRPRTGRDKEVRDYVFQGDGARTFVERFTSMLEPVFEGYRTENKHYATIAIGCTGGKHRSVAMTEEVAKRLSKLPRVVVNVEHRDVGRE